MKAEVILGGNAIRLSEMTDAEYRQVHWSFTKEIKGWHFKKKNAKFKRGNWNGKIEFIDSLNRLHTGLWNELRKFCKEFDFPLRMTGLDQIIDTTFDVEAFTQWVEAFFANNEKKPRDYQIEAAAKVLRYRRCLAELATSAGKTLVFFMILAYLKEKGLAKQMLLIVPNLSLIGQTYEELEDHAAACGFDLKLQMMHGKTSKKKEGADIIIGTYQTLINLIEDDPEFYLDFDVVAVDEAHGANCVSIKKILLNCRNAKYRFGMSGSFVLGDDADSFTLQEGLGPLVTKVSAQFLIKEGFATKVAVKIIKLDYLDEKTKRDLATLKDSKTVDGAKVLALERRLIIHDRKRLAYLCDLIGKTKANALVLFSDKKHGYGKSIYNHLRETTDKEVFYVDGDTPAALRDEIKARMNEGSNRVLCASYKTFSVGISIPQLYYVFSTESFKAETLIKQMIGRGMRLAQGKDIVVLYDIVDDFSVAGIENFAMKHSKDRIAIYKREGHPYKVYEVKL